MDRGNPLCSLHLKPIKGDPYKRKIAFKRMTLRRFDYTRVGANWPSSLRSHWPRAVLTSRVTSWVSWPVIGWLFVDHYRTYSRPSVAGRAQMASPTSAANVNMLENIKTDMWNKASNGNMEEYQKWDKETWKVIMKYITLHKWKWHSRKKKDRNMRETGHGWW